MVTNNEILSDGEGISMRFNKRVRHAALGAGVMFLVISVGALWLDAGSPPMAAAPPLSVAPPVLKPVASDLIVHEWGTFLGMNGSDGSSLDGMYHEEHALPAFVHSRSRDQLRLPFILLKGETPVIDFYTETRQFVRLGVGFPQGIWTQWYPQALLVNPSLAQSAEDLDHPRNGRICWQAEIIPASVAGPDVKIPVTSSEALWNHARQVDSAYVKTFDGTRDTPQPEFEKFLFYRGLGEARLPVRLDARLNGTLRVDREPAPGQQVITQIFVIRVENGRGAYRFRPTLRTGEEVTGVIPSMAESRPLPEFTKSIADDLAARLVEAGLYAKEARAMVNTWTSSYFQSEGIRALFVLPQSWTDAFIPMTVVPRPKEIIRVMVGRLELLTGEREQMAEAAIRDLTGGDSAKRQAAFEFLREQGRYVEPIVRRVMKETRDDTTRTLCRRLLRADFITGLRAAVNDASDGRRLTSDPVSTPRSSGPCASGGGLPRRSPRRSRGRACGPQIPPGRSGSDPCRQPQHT